MLKSLSRVVVFLVAVMGVAACQADAERAGSLVSPVSPSASAVKASDLVGPYHVVAETTERKGVIRAQFNTVLQPSGGGLTFNDPDGHVYFLTPSTVGFPAGVWPGQPTPWPYEFALTSDGAGSPCNYFVRGGADVKGHKIQGLLYVIDEDCKDDNLAFTMLKQ